MPWLSAVVLFYGVLNIVGGVIGYSTAGSIWSLVGGGAVGLALIFAAALSKTHPNKGFLIAGIATLVAAGIMAERVMKTAGSPGAGRNIGLLALAIIMLGLLAYGHFSEKPSTPEKPDSSSTN